MIAGQISGAIDRVRDRILAQDQREPSDGQLLERFVDGRDEAAFSAIVRRHGPMVLGVCRRVAGDPHDAEDAFQATFLVLARKAGTLSRRELLPSWLHGVARRTALKARGVALRRRLRERPLEGLPHPPSEHRPTCDHDLRAVLDEELGRLPEQYRLAVVLCELEGRPRREVAGRLAIPEGTLSSRLAEARRLLARRLGRRGLGPSDALMALLSPGAASACVSSSLLDSTVKTAAGDLLAGTVPASVAALAEGGMWTVYLNKIKFVALLLVCALTVSGIAAGVLAAGAAARQDDERQKPAQAKEAKAAEKQEKKEGKWQDLLGQIDPEKHTVGKGVWRLKDGKVTAYPAGHGARLRVPVVPKGNYELRARWEPKDGQSSVAFIVPHGGDRMASVEVLTSMGCAGLGDLNGVRPDVNETKTAVKIKPGKVYDVAIRVTVDGDKVEVVATLDKQTIVEWKGKRSELEHEFFAPPGPASLGLGIGGNVSVFHSLELRMLTGAAEDWKPASKPTKDQ